MARRLRVRVDQTLCVGSGVCTYTAPGVFELDATGHSTVVDPGGGTEEQILEAADGCPVSAILVEDADTGEQLFP